MGGISICKFLIESGKLPVSDNVNLNYKKITEKTIAPFSKREIKNPLALMVGVRGLLAIVMHCSG